jgi:hypothetical protein
LLMLPSTSTSIARIADSVKKKTRDSNCHPALTYCHA